MDFSKMIIEGLTKHDKKIVSDNPNQSIEQLMSMGLTDKGELVLRGIVARVKPYVAKNSGTLQPTSVRHTPQPRRNAPPQRAWVENKRTGLTVGVSQKAAQKITGKLNPSREMGKNYGTNYNQVG